MVWNAIDWFFHARVGSKACEMCGYVRIAYAFLVLCDKLLWSVDFEFFFLSGRLPYEATSKIASLDNCFSIFSLAPESDLLYLSMHVLSMVSAVLLLLGIAPRLQLLLMHFCFLSFHHHNTVIWDGEDCMFRVWNFLMMFLPLHRVTIYDLSTEKRRPQSDPREESWPMWPFRLWQIEVCYIYAGAAFGKLSSDRWRSGVALYHVRSCGPAKQLHLSHTRTFQVIHITDFFGGAFTPDILYNRVGPLMLMTYASLFVETFCILFIWPQRTRFLTFCAVIGLHLGIELSMNMHCFEWLAMLGWVFFLAEPVYQKPSESKLSRHALTAGLLLLLAVFAIDTVPLDEFFDATRGTFDAFRPPVMRFKYGAQEHVVHRFLSPVGLAQGVWNMFMAAPDQVFTYEAAMKLQNGTVVVWNQPHWDDMNWLEKKRWQRPMTYYDTLGDGHEWPVMEAFARGIAMDHGGGVDNVRSVLITVHTDRPPPPTGLGFFDRAKQKRYREGSKRIFSLNLCDDMDSRCAGWAKAGDCNSPQVRNMLYVLRYVLFSCHYFEQQHMYVMLDTCRQSCGFCYDTSILRVKSRIAILHPDDWNFYVATVVEITNGARRFRIEYDDYEYDYERFEWLDRVDMRQRKFKVLSKEEDPDMQEPTPAVTDSPTASRLNDPEDGSYLNNRPIQLKAEVKQVRRDPEQQKAYETWKTSSKTAPEKDDVHQPPTSREQENDPKPPESGKSENGLEVDVTMDPSASSTETRHAGVTQEPESDLDAPGEQNNPPRAVISEEKTPDNGSETTATNGQFVVREIGSSGGTLTIDNTETSSGTSLRQDEDHPPVKLNVKVDINPGMVWLNDKQPKRIENSPGKEEL